MSTLTELITKFSFEGSTKPLADYRERLSQSIKGMAGFAAAIVGAGVAAAAWISPILDGVDVLGNLSQELDISIGKIQEWGWAAQMSNSSSEELNESLKGLAQRAAMVKNGIGGSEDAFSKLGISVTDTNGQMKNAADLMDEVRQNMNRLNLSTGERSAFARKLGISTNLVQLLSRTDEEMQGLILSAREMGTLTNEQAEAAAEYNDALDMMRYAMGAIKQFTATALAPAFTDLIKQFTGLLVKNRGWIVGGLKVTITFIADVIGMIGRLMPILIGLGVAFVALKIYTLGFAAAMGVLFSPVVLITAAIFAAMVVVDDLIVAFKGGESVIGGVFKTILPYIETVIDYLKNMWEWVMRIVDAYKWGFGVAKEFAGAIVGNGAAPRPLVTTGGRGGLSGNQTDNRRVEQNVEIKINTTDPVRAGKVAAESLQQQLRDGNAQVSVGGF